jgi:hypothetical protein
LSFCYVVVVIAAVSGALFVPLMLELNHLPLSSAEAQRVADQFELLHSRFWPVVAVVSVLLLIVHGVFLFASDRRSALSLSPDFPVRRERRSDRAHLDSQGDYLHVEAQCLGEMVDALREKIGRIEAHHADIAPQLERLKQAAAVGVAGGGAGGRPITCDRRTARAGDGAVSRPRRMSSRPGRCSCPLRQDFRHRMAYVHTAAGSRALRSSS